MMSSRLGSRFLCILCSLLCVKLAFGTPQFTDCPSSVCLSQLVDYVCTVDTSGSADNLRWRIRDRNGDQSDGLAGYNEGQSAVGENSRLTIGTDFTTILISNSNPMISNISFTPTLSISNYTVECEVIGGSTVNCPILIEGIPSAPVPDPLSFTSSSLTLSWSPSTSNCFSHYSVTVTSLPSTINTTDTSFSLPISPPFDPTQYSIDVSAIDVAGRGSVGGGSQVFIADVPLPVTGLTLNQDTYPSNATNTTEVNITVTWDAQSQESPRPTVIEYQVTHNVTDPTTVIIPNNTLTLTGATVGSVYTVQVLASNILGNGPTVNSTIDILFTSPSPIPPDDDVTSSPLPSMSMSPTEPTEPTDPTDPVRQKGLGAGAIVGIVIAVIVLLILVAVVIAIMVYCLCFKDRDGKKTSPQQDEAQGSYTEVQYSGPPSSKKSKKTASSKPPKSHESVQYSAVQHSHEQVQYADLDVSRGTGKRPQNNSGVEYSSVKPQH